MSIICLFYLLKELKSTLEVCNYGSFTVKFPTWKMFRLQYRKCVCGEFIKLMCVLNGAKVCLSVKNKLLHNLALF